jgi:hypothetical protein
MCKQGWTHRHKKKDGLTDTTETYCQACTHRHKPAPHTHKRQTKLGHMFWNACTKCTCRHVVRTYRETYSHTVTHKLMHRRSPVRRHGHTDIVTCPSAHASMNKHRSTWEKPTRMTLCSSQIPFDLTWEVRIWRWTTWAIMVWPVDHEEHRNSTGS